MTSLRLLFCLFAIGFLSACETTEEPRMRAGIHDPIERHPKRKLQLPSLLPDDISVTSMPGEDGAA